MTRTEHAALIAALSRLVVVAAYSFDANVRGSGALTDAAALLVGMGAVVPKVPPFNDSTVLERAAAWKAELEGTAPNA